MPGSWTHPCSVWMQSMGCFDLAHSQHLQAWLVPAPLAILAQHPPWGGWDTAAKASLDVPLPTWGRVRPGRAPACSRKPLLAQRLREPPESPSLGGSALAPQWDREVPALGLVSWSLPVFLLHGLKTKLILASGSLSFIPDCCSPRPSPCIFSGPLESPVCPRPAPVHPPLGHLGVQHPAAGIFITQSTGFVASFGSPRPVCHIYRLLGQGAEPWGIPAGSCSAGRQDFVVACGPLVCSWCLQLRNGWQAMTPYIREERGHPPGLWAAGCSDENQMSLSCPQAALVTRTGCPHCLARQAPAEERDTRLATWGQQIYGFPSQQQHTSIWGMPGLSGIYKQAEYRGQSSPIFWLLGCYISSRHQPLNQHQMPGNY